MTGTLINAAAVALGGSAGLLLGSRLSERSRETVMDGIGLVTVVLGTQMALKTQNPLVVLLAMLLGALVGEWARIEDRLAGLGDALKARVRGRQGARFTEGFVAASLLFCVGPMAILGSVDDGLRGDYTVLAVKSVLDGFSALAFASTMGVGVLFSIPAILIYQGGLTLLAGTVQAVFTPPVVAELTATGGVMVIGIGFRLLNIRDIRVGNFLPALLFAPLILAAFQTL